MCSNIVDQVELVSFEKKKNFLFCLENSLLSKPQFIFRESTQIYFPREIFPDLLFVTIVTGLPILVSG